MNTPPMIDAYAAADASRDMASALIESLRLGGDFARVAVRRFFTRLMVAGATPDDIDDFREALDSVDDGHGPLSQYCTLYFTLSSLLEALFHRLNFIINP